MTGTTEIAIQPEDRTLAALTHLSGLSGYIIPFAGVLVPIIIWMVKKDAPLISAIARQAILLNVVVFAVACALVLAFFTIILIPAVLLGGIVLAIGSIALPIVGAIKAGDGRYYRYPVVGSNP